MREFVANIRRFSSVLVFSVILTAVSPTYAADLVLNNVPTKVFFSPNGGCTEAIIDEINDVKTEILVQTYSFTSALIAKALLAAHKRGVKVEVILDKSQRTARYSSATFFANSRMPTFIDAAHAIAHNKVMVIHGPSVIIVSLNYTRSVSEKSAKNVVIVRSTEMATLYKDNWNEHTLRSAYSDVLRTPTVVEGIAYFESAW